MLFDAGVSSSCLARVLDDTHFLKDECARLAGEVISLTTSRVGELAARDDAHKLDVDNMVAEIDTLYERVLRIEGASKEQKRKEKEAVRLTEDALKGHLEELEVVYNIVLGKTMGLYDVCSLFFTCSTLFGIVFWIQC